MAEGRWAREKALIQAVVNVFETGRPEGRYDAIAVMKDGRNGTRQISYGRCQVTEQGRLAELLRLYCEQEDAAYRKRVLYFLPKVGAEPLAGNRSFRALLREAAQDPLMRRAQDLFFDTAYWVPAFRWFERRGFSLPLALLVVFDSYIHSGGVPMFLRRRFAEPVPADGGAERRWLGRYVETRHQWLKHHKRAVLRATTYRTEFMAGEMEKRNWWLRQLPLDVRGVTVG